MADIQTTQELEHLRGALNEKLGELHRRASEARRLMSPAYYLNHPWFRFALGVVVGYALTRVLSPQPRQS